LALAGSYISRSGLASGSLLRNSDPIARCKRFVPGKSPVGCKSAATAAGIIIDSNNEQVNNQTLKESRSFIEALLPDLS